MDQALEFLEFALTTTLALAVYFAPAIIAHKRVPLMAFRIFNWNLFTGWTVLGWVFTLVWAIKAPHPPGQERMG